MENTRPVSRKILIAEARKIATLGDANLAQLSGLCQEKELQQDYYLGMIRRQVHLLHDIATLMESDAHQNFSSIFILCRCLLDDFLHVFYLKQCGHEKDEITNLNADVHRQAFLALEVTMLSNHKHFKGRYPHYMTKQEFDQLKAHFQSRKENNIFFRNKASFSFKRFKTLSEVAEGIADFELSKLSRRAYYIWKDTSEFIHYSNATFERESSQDDHLHNLYLIEEVMLYAYNTIELSWRHFADVLAFELIDQDQLKDRYAINYQ